MGPGHVNPLQWHQAVGVARQSCARFFRDGGTPQEALAAFGLNLATAEPVSWEKAVDQILGVGELLPRRSGVGEDQTEYAVGSVVSVG